MAAFLAAAEAKSLDAFFLMWRYAEAAVSDRDRQTDRQRERERERQGNIYIGMHT
jgi:hypothetical protein